MRELLSPKQVARAMGTSESSVKRWCDRGILRCARTAGGHRRLRLREVVQFLRRTQRALVRPEVLGLPATIGQGERVIGRARDQMKSALLDGDELRVRTVGLDLYLAGHSACDICDRVVAWAFHDIGDRWECGEIEVYQERRACEMTLRLLHALREMLPEAPPSAARAIGGTLVGDAYRIPTTMVELVLRETGWRAQSYGIGLPGPTLRAAIEENQPRLFWLSVSHIVDLEDFVIEYQRVYEAAAANGVAIAVGGRALTEEVRERIEYGAYCDSLKHLVSFAQTIHRPMGDGEAAKPS